MKLISIFSLLALLSWGGYKLLQSPEKYLKKKTIYLIKMASLKNPQTDIGLLSRVSKMTKYIHFDVQLSAEYENRTYKARSLNEFRSLLMSYFKQQTTGSFDYKNLTVQLEPKSNQAEVRFDGLFHRKKQVITCKILLNWLKEKKKWYVKKVDVSLCF